MKQELGLVKYSLVGVLLAWMITFDPRDVTWHSLIAFAAALAYLAYKLFKRLERLFKKPPEATKKRS